MFFSRDFVGFSMVFPCFSMFFHDFFMVFMSFHRFFMSFHASSWTRWPPRGSDAAFRHPYVKALLQHARKRAPWLQTPLAWSFSFDFASFSLLFAGFPLGLSGETHGGGMRKEAFAMLSSMFLMAVPEVSFGLDWVICVRTYGRSGYDPRSGKAMKKGRRFGLQGVGNAIKNH